MIRREAKVPPTHALANAPWCDIPLHQPPQIAWMSVARHGRHAIESYLLPHLWCLNLYRWAGAVTVGGIGKGATFAIRPGYASLLPPATPMTFYYPVSTRLDAVVYSAGFALPAGARNRDGDIPTASILDLGRDFGRLVELCESGATFLSHQPQRAQSRLWEVLWEFVTLAARGDADRSMRTDIDPRVRRLQELIEVRLGEPQLRIGELVTDVGLSLTHASRLFNTATGSTLVGYLRRRRVERAIQLLQHTTMSIKSVAAQVGLPDLQKFNKTLRQTVGRSPREIRDPQRVNF